MRTIEFDPVRIDALCKHCGGELFVSGERQDGIAIKGLRDLVYRHVGSRSIECTTTHTAAPYDPWRATREYEAGVRAGRRRESETT